MRVVRLEATDAVKKPRSVDRDVAQGFYDDLGIEDIGASFAAFLTGMNIELEHWGTIKGDMAKVAGIARDHLEEFPDYYPALVKMEKELGAMRRGGAAAPEPEEG